MKRLAFLTALGLLVHSVEPIYAQIEPQSAQVDTVNWENMLDAVVVTATRTEVSVKELGSSITVISATDIDRSQQTTVLDALRSAPGLDIVQSGGAGKLTSLFLRGSDAGHTLVLIDGVEMNDPVSVGRTYNFSDLPVDNIDRIEVLRGPQSTLYGSDAIGGVVNIVTRRGTGRPSMRLSTMGGSLGTLRGYGRVAGGTSQYHYSMGLSWLNVGGISAASETKGNTEPDSHRNATVSGRVGFTPNDRLGLDLVFRSIDTASDIDNGGGVGQDDPNNRQDSRQIFVRPEVSLKLWDRRWLQTFGYAFSDHDRQNKNPTDASHPVDSSESTFKGRIHQLHWQNTLHFHENSTLTFGAETEEEQGNSTFRSDGAFGPFESIFAAQAARITGYYIQNQFQYQNMVFLTAGARLDDHSIYGNQGTYRVAPAVFVAKTGTRLKGSYGTGFKAPSLFQLYSSFGNPTLQPGESKGWDAGIEQYGWHERVGFGATYFRNDFTNLIDFDNNRFTYN
ncbi:MAG: TonB-dependent receptor, partial [Candidatus Latescibacteria bacterium]|nr:TonB-dependent receptor [Candidatus Latescibacterota bacterium]